MAMAVSTDAQDGFSNHNGNSNASCCRVAGQRSPRLNGAAGREMPTLLFPSKSSSDMKLRSASGKAWLPKATALKTEFHKACWTVLTTVGGRSLLGSVFPGSLCFYDRAKHPGVKGLLALTLDDGPCRRRDGDFCMVAEIRELLREFDAQATFFCCTDYVDGHEEVMHDLLRDGHEVANHCPADRSYAGDSEEAFEAALLQSEGVCDGLRAAVAGQEGTSCRDTDAASEVLAARWFRAPHGRMSAPMKKVLDKHGFTNVLTDCYGNDPWIGDADYLAQNMLDHARDGSIAVIHMPERGFREYNLKALRMFLEGLREHGVQVVNLSTLHREAHRHVEAPVSEPFEESPAAVMLGGTVLLVLVGILLSLAAIPPGLFPYAFRVQSP